MLSNFLVFHTSGSISSTPTAFLFLIFLITKSSFSCINCPSLMSSWLLIISMIGSSVTFRGFPSKFLKCCFYRCIHSSWLAAFSLALAVFFLLLTLFTVCHAIQDCLSSTEFLILLIWFWMYSVYFRYTLVSSFCALSFWTLILVGILLLHRDAVFTSACSFFFFFFFFFFNRKCLQWDSRFSSLFHWYALCCHFYVSPDKLLIFVIRSKYFWYLLKCIEFVS